MSEIEKLYENAGVEIQYGYDVYNKKSEHYRLLNCNKNAVITLFPECKSKGYKVTKVNKTANFTAEKQLELIKWLTKREDFALGYYPSYNIWVAKTEFCWEYYEKTYEHKNPEQALAGLINNLWQDLTDTEKAEIKRILE